MIDDEIEDLIAEWETLRIRADAIVEQLEAANARRTSTDTHGTSNRTNPTTAHVLTVNGLKRGDRVVIKNKVNKPATWPTEKAWEKEKARFATVTRVTREQIHFVTDNGVNTWRAPNNLRKVSSSELFPVIGR
jgi:hypothetical protein